MRWLWVSLLAFAATRLGIALIAYLAATLLGNSPRPPGSVLLDVFANRWDTEYYLGIAERGYGEHGVPLPAVAFFPLLPLLIRVLAGLVGDPRVAGLLITNAALLAATTLLYRLAEADWGADVADRTVWYLLIFPTSFFGSAIYSESPFLLGAIGALYAARAGRWRTAATLGFLTALTRLVGVVAAPMLIAEWWLQRRRAPERLPLVALGAPAAAPLGLFAYMLYLRLVFGEPLAFVNASAAWGRAPHSPFALLAGQLALNSWIDLLMPLLFVGLGGVLLHQRRWSEGVFVMFGTLIPLCSGLLDSQRRYMWVLFPAFVLLARWGERRWVDRTIILISLVGLAVSVVLFATGYWVA